MTTPVNLYRVYIPCRNMIRTGRNKARCSSTFVVNDALGFRCIWCHELRKAGEVPLEKRLAPKKPKLKR